MLLGVEGGFFSSSASGCSKGLALLFLGHKNEDKPMRVTPLSPYQLVEPGPCPDREPHLDSAKKRLSRRCASIIRFGCASAGIDPSLPLEADPTKQQEVLIDPGNDSDQITKDDDGKTMPMISRKSSLKRTSNRDSVDTVVDSGHAENLGENRCHPDGRIDGRKVQWTDVCGRELVQIWEFEPSETYGSENDADGGYDRSCNCVIM